VPLQIPEQQSLACVQLPSRSTQHAPLKHSERPPKLPQSSTVEQGSPTSAAHVFLLVQPRESQQSW
jgi:hypothetical protein